MPRSARRRTGPRGRVRPPVAKWVRPEHVRTDAAWRHRDQDADGEVQHRDNFAGNGFTGPIAG
ncbi:hypothetical protein AB0J90_16190 [Micromonospora sp. NPDC049523]|uniref:hypothetical protein n=1 Tax=Micromonospora sp. NPDC049523 TaxID=3155921 RepID=UPI00341BABCA